MHHFASNFNWKHFYTPVYQNAREYKTLSKVNGLEISGSYVQTSILKIKVRNQWHLPTLPSTPVVSTKDTH